MKERLLQFAALSVCGILSIPGWAQTAGTLTVKAATSKHVDLTWTGAASSYTIQRAPLGGSFSSIGTATSAAYSDTSVDAYATYQYQIVAGSSTSNKVTAGPPPVGLSAPAPAPLVGSSPSMSYGYDLVATLDTNGDPAFAFLWEDPNNDGDDSDTTLMFRSWNRAQYAWKPVVRVGVVTDSTTTFHQSVAVAIDAGTGAFALACEHNVSGALDIFTSPDGITWSKKTTLSYNDSAWSPSMVLANGNLYLAFDRDYEGILYVTGKLTADPATWTTKTAPVPSGTTIAQNATTISLALDSAGNPGIAYIVGDTKQSYNQILMFWKPASGGAPVRVTDSENNQTDSSVKLVYYNLNPRILFYMQRNDADFGDGNHYVQSNDGGATWQLPVPIPPDGNSSTDYPFDMAVGSQGQVAIGFGQNAGSGDDVCARPKLATSTDGVHFKSCAIAGTDVLGQFGPFPSGIQLAYGGNDKLYYLWWPAQNDDPNTAGIVMYREPPAGTTTAPVISTVVDGASFRPNIVAGSWVTVQGVNLSTQTRIWNGGDFNNGNILPTNLSGVQVKVNGVFCAVYYISSSQINFQAPSNISGSVTVQVIVNNVASNTLTATAVSAAPALFTYNAGSNTFPSAVFPATNLIVGDPAISGNVVSKAHAGDVISLYGTGFMPTPGGVIPGSVINVSTNVTVTMTSTTNSSVTANAVVTFAGLTAVGEFQINIVMPTLPAGTYTLVVSTAGQSSQSGVTIPIA